MHWQSASFDSHLEAPTPLPRPPDAPLSARTAPVERGGVDASGQAHALTSSPAELGASLVPASIVEPLLRPSLGWEARSAHLICLAETLAERARATDSHGRAVDKRLLDVLCASAADVHARVACAGLGALTAALDAAFALPAACLDGAVAVTFHR